MTVLDIASLRKIAEKATPGPWKLSEANNYTGVVSADHRLFIEAFREANGWPSEDLEHIAALNPATVLALLDRLERAEARVEHLEADAALDTEGNLHLYDDLKKAEAAIERVRAVHRRLDLRDIDGVILSSECDYCSGISDGFWDEWPCPTIAALGTEDK